MKRFRGRSKETDLRNWKEAVWYVSREIGRDGNKVTGSIYAKSAWCWET